MTPLKLALKYMAAFFGEAPLISMKDILAQDLVFTGPFFSFDSADEYMESLLADPITDAGYKLIHTYEDSTSACLVYEFTKPGIKTTMSQLFEIEDEKIKRIELVFDSKAFSDIR